MKAFVSAEQALTENEKKTAGMGDNGIHHDQLRDPRFFFIVVPAYCFTLLKSIVSNTFLLISSKAASVWGFFSVF